MSGRRSVQLLSAAKCLGRPLFSVAELESPLLTRSYPTGDVDAQHARMYRMYVPMHTTSGAVRKPSTTNSPSLSLSYIHTRLTHSLSHSFLTSLHPFTDISVSSDFLLPCVMAVPPTVVALLGGSVASGLLNPGDIGRALFGGDIGDVCPCCQHKNMRLETKGPFRRIKKSDRTH